MLEQKAEVQQEDSVLCKEEAKLRKWKVLFVGDVDIIADERHLCLCCRQDTRRCGLSYTEARCLEKTGRMGITRATPQEPAHDGMLAVGRLSAIVRLPLWRARAQ